MNGSETFGSAASGICGYRWLLGHKLMAYGSVLMSYQPDINLRPVVVEMI
jgi:hypothetical protein